MLYSQYIERKGREEGRRGPTKIGEVMPPVTVWEKEGDGCPHASHEARATGGRQPGGDGAPAPPPPTPTPNLLLLSPL